MIDHVPLVTTANHVIDVFGLQETQRRKKKATVGKLRQENS